MNCKTTPFTYRKNYIRYLPKMLLLAFFFLSAQMAQAQISGTKTVCATGCDYSSISKAVTDLIAKGINGKTTIEIKSGQYNETVSITGIAGLSDTSTLTFKGVGAKPENVYIYTTDSCVISLKSVSYVVLENLFVEQKTTAANYYGVSLNEVNSCIVRNCKIAVPEITSAVNDLSALIAIKGKDNLIENNTIRGGYYGINEGNLSRGSKDNIYRKNNIKKFFRIGIISYFSRQNLYEANVIDSATDYNATAIFSKNEIDATIKGNFLALNNMAYGAYLVPEGKMELSNNMILGTSVTQYGVYINPVSDYYFSRYPVLFAHNTIHGSATQVRISNEWAAYIDFLNNNLTGDGITLYYTGSSGHDKSKLHLNFEGNNYHCTGSGNLIYFDVAFATLSDYKTALSKYNIGQTDQNISVKYKSSTDLHIDQSTKIPYGKNIGISTDFDGDKRCNFFVTSGADESSYTGNAHYTKPAAPKFTYPSTVYVGNPTVFSNSGKVSDPFLYKWYVDGKFVSDSFHLETYDLKSPSSKVKLVAYNCGGKDSAEVTVSVSVPTKAPVAGFISNVTFVKLDDVIKLEDVSSNYPSGWKWEISPDTVKVNGLFLHSYEVVDGSLTKANPHIKFKVPGKYKICLTASNAIGSNTDCNTDYIEVVSYVNMEENSTVSAPKGYIYDDGGPDGNYNQMGGWFAPESYKLLIDACADSVYIVFTKFDLACGIDNLNIYQGKDNKGKNLFNKCAAQRTYVGYGSTGGPSSTWCIYGSSPGCFPTVSDTLKAKGTMFIELGLDGRFSFPGFEAYYWTKPKNISKPTAKFTIPDSFCINGTLQFINTSVGDDLKYYWDLDGDFFAFESIEKNPHWNYDLEGTVQVTLIVENCGGRDTFSKSVYIYNSRKPKAAFSADNTCPTIDDVVYFKNETSECVDLYRWRFTPATGKGRALYIDGTKNTSANPSVTFTDTGCYSVTLYTSNITGEDSITRSCYIRVKNPYCVPSVNSLSTDIGISKVIFHTISNSSAQATSAYSRYTPLLSLSATIEEGLTYTLKVERSTNKNKATRTVWIDWNLDGDFNDTLELYAQEVNTTNLSWSTNIAMPVFAKYGASVMRIGIDLGSQTARPCGPNQTGEFEDYRIYLSAYKTRPVISLMGIDTVIIQRGYTYNDPAVAATSLRFGDITKSIVTTMPITGFNEVKGTYAIKYDVADSVGNKAVNARRIVMVVADTTPPEVIVDGRDTFLVQVYDTSYYTPAVLKAFDIADSNMVSIKINSNVNISEPGEYDVIYTITDLSGNYTTVVRHIIVIDTILPVLTLIGKDIVIHEVGYQYNDSGVSIIDNYYSEAALRNNLTVTNNVDASIVGDYEVIYELIDPFTRKKITIKRTVLVRDTEKPTIKLTGDTVFLDILAGFNEPGVVVSDNYDKNLTVSKEGTFYQNFPNGRATKTGTYEIIYVVSDAAGNVAKTSRIVIVEDKEAPQITLKGEQTENICRWSSYTDAGYEIRDNYNSVNELTIEVEGTFVTEGSNREGVYSLVYKATDKAGNVAYSPYRFIYVRNPYEFPCSTNISVGPEISLEKLINVYPNPNTGKFTVEANLPVTEQIRISVTNFLGQEVAVISNGALNQNTFSVDLSMQKVGVYMLNITTSTQSVTKPIVVTK